MERGPQYFERQRNEYLINQINNRESLSITSVLKRASVSFVINRDVINSCRKARLVIAGFAKVGSTLGGAARPLTYHCPSFTHPSNPVTGFGVNRSKTSRYGSCWGPPSIVIVREQSRAVIKVRMMGCRTILTAIFSLCTIPASLSHPNVQLFTGDSIGSLLSASTLPQSAPVDGITLQRITTQALQHEQPDATYVLAMLKFYGQGVEEDVVGAIRLLKKLAQRGHRDAEFTLGVLYTSSTEELPRDNVLSAAWLASSANHGHPDAKWMLAECYNEGRGVNQNVGRALELLMDAALKDQNPHAMFRLGVMFEYGRGVKQDVAKAAQLYQVASDEHVVDATFYLALMHASGRGVPKNSKKALILLKNAADQGHGPALLHLGEVYADGVGVTVDYSLALHFFKSALSFSSDSYIRSTAQMRIDELEWVLLEAERLARDQERQLGLPLRVEVGTIDTSHK